jgi:hypothetical protein
MMGGSRRRMVANPINRYSIGDWSDLVPKADSSIYIQTSAPIGRDSNCLPSPTGDFMLWLRVYQPSVRILNGEYQGERMSNTKDKHLLAFAVTMIVIWGLGTVGYI